MGSGAIGSVTLAAKADAATAILRDGGPSGTTILDLSTPLGSTTDKVFLNQREFNGPLHATITGTTPGLTVELV